MPKPKIIVRYDCCKTSLRPLFYGFQCMQCGTVYQRQVTKDEIGRVAKGKYAPLHDLPETTAANLKKGLSQ